MASAKVVVIGDIMLDEYIWGDTDRVSPEAPVPVVSLTGRTHTLGGAGNAARGVAALGGEVLLVGVVGADSEAELVRSLLPGSSITDGIVCIPGRPTTTKTRVIANHQQVVRIDREDSAPMSADTEQRLVQVTLEALRSVDCVLLSDYAKGVVTRALAQAIIAAATDAGVPVVVDPKGTDFRKYHGATIVKPNRREAFLAASAGSHGNVAVDDIGAQLVEMVGCSVLVTLGAEGMRLFQKGQPAMSVRSIAIPAYDVTGAGDTVAAVLALALGTNAPLAEAASLAASAAAVVVGKVGTAFVTSEELLASLDATDPYTTDPYTTPAPLPPHGRHSVTASPPGALGDGAASVAPLS